MHLQMCLTFGVHIKTKPVFRPKTRMVYRQARKRTFTELPTFDRKW
jgi:hypothetical protein